MIERVARAIQDKSRLYDCDPGDPLEMWAVEAARAAIEAMREPTKKMEEAGNDLDDWGCPSDPGGGNASALAHWHAMIDTALKETTPA